MNNYRKNICPNNMANTPVTLPETGEDGSAGIPVIPLPDPGEGGPVVAPGDENGSAGIPVIPLPDPGQGGPVVAPGDENDSAGIPVVPLPDPGQGGPVHPLYPDRPNRPNWPIYPVFPLPSLPCFVCQDQGNSNNYCKVRFLNAVNQYSSLVVVISGRQVASGLSFASLTSYGKVSDGFRTVTIALPNGYVLLRKSIPFHAGTTVTMAIIPSASGLDLMEISDTPCSNRSYGYSCFRVCNLAYYSNPLDVILYDGRIVYSDVRFKEVTSFKQIRPGEYDFYLAETVLSPMPRSMDIETLDSASSDVIYPEPLLSFYVNVRSNAMYTVYILGRDNTSTSLQTIIVEDIQ